MTKLFGLLGLLGLFITIGCASCPHYVDLRDRIEKLTADQVELQNVVKILVIEHLNRPKQKLDRAW